ncbi:hypothetical protein LIER_12640 [Lithospermum erythrorhizon]|uniref:DUF7032 domain-containing protein n=1 Tax=Lithospermum erythrorhizon TaxID=34254 RepID=A0AAV3PVL8_LITER
MHQLTGGTSTDRIVEQVRRLIATSVAVSSFSSRWQSLRGKLGVLESMLLEIPESPNPLLTNLLKNIEPTLERVWSLWCGCSDPSHPPGKLLMQSDLDMASGWLSKHNHDLDLLLRSGVLRHSNAIVLSQPSPHASKEVQALFVRDIFTRLQIGTPDFRKKALDSLLRLLTDNPKAALLVSTSQADIGCLLALLDSNVSSSTLEQAVSVVSILASACDQSKKCLFEQGALGPLLKIIETASMPIKEKAAMSVECITSDSDHAWAISAYTGLPILLQLCKSGSALAQSYSVGVIKNVSTVEDIRFALAEEGVVPVLLQLLVSGNASAQEKAANCISILSSSGECFRQLLLGEDGLQSLLHCLGESSSSVTLEHVLMAIYSLSASDSVSRVLSSSSTFILQIAELLKQGNVMLQHISASLLSKLSIGEVNKRAVCGCMGSLVKLMELAKPDSLQEVAANALVSLLTVRSNRKNLVKDEKSMMRLVHMLDPGSELVSKKFPVAVMAAIMAGGSQSCRKRLLAAGVNAHLQRLSEMEVSGAKKAMQKLSVNRIKNIFTMPWRE